MTIDETALYFPNQKCSRWDIFMAECSRYTLRIVLQKKEKRK